MDNIKPVVGEASRAHNAAHSYRRGGAAPRPIENTKGKMPTGRNVGKLMKVLNMPLEIFYEITSHLQPLDLLQLSRASNELRDMLLSRTSRHMWVAARKNVYPPLPDCASYLSEPLYAHILFERICSACGVGRALFPELTVPARFCGPCSKANFEKGTQVVRELKIPKDHIDELVNMLPSATIYSLEDDWKPYKGLRQSIIQRFYKPRFAAVAKQYGELRASKDEEALRHFVNKCKADALERYNFLVAVQLWEYGAQDRKTTENDKAKRERRADIYAKLQELGYQEAEFPRYDSTWWACINQPRKLTTRIWNTIRPKLVEILDAERRKREKEAFELKWHQRLSQLQALYSTFLQKDRDIDQRKRTFPCWGSVIELGFMQSLLTSKDPEVDILPEDFRAVEDAILTHGDKFLSSARQKLAGRLREKLSASKETPSTTAGRSAKSNSNSKGKKKASITNDEAAGDVGALLDQHEALFSCSCGWRPFLFSWSGLLEHQQKDHKNTPFDASGALACPGNAATVKELLRALGLPASAGLSEVENLAASGQPVCTCCPEFEDSSSYLEMEPYCRLYRLLKHMLCPPMNSEVHKGPDTAVHRITFKPLTNEASNGW